MERPIGDSASPIRDGAGDVACCAPVFRDAAGRRDVEEPLRRRMGRLKSPAAAAGRVRMR